MPERSKLKSVIQQHANSECLEGPLPSLQNPLEDRTKKPQRLKTAAVGGQSGAFLSKSLAHSFLTLF